MSCIEMKINALMRYVTAADDAEQAAVKAEITDLMNRTGRKASASGLENLVRSTLTKLGVPEHIKGHRYLVKAIQWALQNPGEMRVTKVLYPEIAKECGTTPSRTERAIRHAIEVSWTRCDYETLEKYFGCTISPARGKPTNSEYIARVASIVRMRLGEMG